MTNAFATYDTLGDVLSAIGGKANVQRFLKAEDLVDDGFVMSYIIDPGVAEKMRWLEYGLRGKKACEEAWWNCVWLVAKPTIARILEIKQRIDKDVPLAKKHLFLLDKYISCGCPRGYWSAEKDEDDRMTYKVILTCYPNLEQLEAVVWAWPGLRNLTK